MSVSTAYLCTAPPPPLPPPSQGGAAPAQPPHSYGVMSYMSSPPTPGHHHPGTVAHAAHAAAQAHAAAAAHQMAQIGVASGQYGLGHPPGAVPGSGGAGGQSQLFNVGALLNQKDSRWLQLEVCREYQRNKCSRTDCECKFAHPPDNVEVQNGKVTACYDSIKVRHKQKHQTCIKHRYEAR